MEWPAKFSVKNPLLIITVALLTLVGGYYAFKKLPVDAFPDITPTMVQIFTETHGLAPEEVEKFVTYPLETGMNGLPSLKKIRSISNYGLSLINLYFEDGTDPYFARQVVSERLREVSREIPPEFGHPEMGPISTALGLILFYYIEDETKKHSLMELRTIQDWLIKPQLMAVPGVNEVLGIGGFRKQYKVQVNPDALLFYKTTLPEIVEAIEKSNLNAGGSFIERGGEELTVRSEGLITGLEELKKVVVKEFNGAPVKIEELGEVKIGGAIRRGLQTKDGREEVVAGQVIKLYGENSSEVIERVNRKIEELNRSLPEGVKIVPYYQQKSLIDACISTITSALEQGLLLVVAVLFLFMGGFRPSLIAALSIPFSMAFAFIGMKLLGLSANLMSLGGIAIAIGILVDGAIVLVEAVDKKLREGLGRKEAVLAAFREVARPIAFALFIVSVVFVPILSLSGVEGKTFRPLAITVILAVAGSLLYALFVAPALSSLLVGKPSSNPVSRGLENFLITLYKPVGKLFVKVKPLALISAGALILLGVFVAGRLGSEFVPKLQEGTVVLRLTMAPSISLNESKRITMLVERRLLKVPEVESVVSRIGRGEVGAHTDPVNSAEMFILLKPKEEWRVETQEELVELLRKELGEIPGVLTNFTQPIEMTIDELLEGVRADIAVKVFGEDIKKLKELADRVAEILKGVKGAVDVQVEQVVGAPQLLIIPDRNKLALYGISLKDFQDVVETGVGGKVAGHVYEGLKKFEIFVRFKEEKRSSPDEIKKLPVPTKGGEFVPLGEVAEVKEVAGLRQITREDLSRFVTVQCNVSGRDIGTFVEEAKKAVEAAVALPPGYFITWGGEFELKEEAEKRLRVVVPITLLIVFILLFSSLNSLRLTLLMAFNLPLAVVGGLLALWLTGQHFSVPAIVGIIALLGIALEAGMVLLTYAEELKKRGLEPKEAALEAAKERLRPIVMTALTTSMGLLPLLFATGTGSEVQRPLAAVVIGGLFTATFATLFILPALYAWSSRKV